MDHTAILTNPSEAELAAAVEENLFALFRAMTTLPGSEIVEAEEYSYHHTPPINPMFKGVWRTRLSESEVDSAIDDMVKWFGDHNAPFFFWWTGPGTTPPDLDKRLIARGFSSMVELQKELTPGIISTEAGAPGMVADLHQMNEAVIQQVPDGFTIEEVQNEASLIDFKNVLVAGYEIPEPVAHAWVDAALLAGIGQTPWKMYVGRLNGEAVATNMILNGGGVSGVYAVATIPAARGKGIGAAITLQPLLAARDAGYNHAVLFATEMGISVYERIGFRLCDVRLNRFLWRSI